MTMAIMATVDTISTHQTEQSDATRARPGDSCRIATDSEGEAGGRSPSRLKFEPLDSVVQDPYDNVACTD
jgi:hypothetical protein